MSGATFADWEQADGELPDWQEGHSRITAGGQPASLTSATDAQRTRDFLSPVLPS